MNTQGLNRHAGNACMVLSFALLGVGCCHFDRFARHRIHLRPFAENPTAWVFNVPTDSIRTALVAFGEVGFNVAHIHPPARWSDVVPPSVIDSQLTLVATVYNMSSPEADTNVYCFDGRPLVHRPGVMIVTVHELGGAVKVKVRANYVVAFGTEIDITNLGCMAHYEPVPSATIHEYQLLLFIGASVGDTAMPRLSMPVAGGCP